MADPAAPASRRALYAAGLTIMVVTAAGCLLLALTYISGEQYTGWRKPIVVLSLAAASLTAVTMTADLVDLWMLGRRFSALSVKMVHSLVFVATLVAVGLSIVTSTSGLLLLMTPALAIYFMTVMRRPERTPGGARQAARPGRAPARPARQRRGGRKR